MPRIDPSKLLETLKPLLDINTGGIKTNRDADKIYHLMQKFSKKLVSKCIYLNILLASNDETLDVFMENGGWSMIYEWLLESSKQGHNSVVNDILSVLLKTPATITRLKSSALPREVKGLVKSEVEGTRNLAEQVVAKWLQIARSGLKAENSEIVPQPVATGGSSSLPSPAINGIPAVVNFTVNNSNGHDVTENLAMSDDVISATLAANGNFDVGQVNNTDFDDLQNIDLMDINPEMLELLAEHLNPLENENQLGVANTETNMLPTNFVQQQPVAALGASEQRGNQIQIQPVHQQVNIQPNNALTSVATSVIQQSIVLQQHIPNVAVSAPTQVITSTVQQQQTQSSPKFIIRKIGVQPTVIPGGNTDGTPRTIYITSPSPQQQQYTLINRNGKQFLIINNNASVVTENVATVQQPVVVPENVSTPMKPAILNHRTPTTPKASASSSEEASPPKPLKTYSKKTNHENASDVVDSAKTKSPSEKPSGTKSSSKSSSSSSTSSRSSSASKSSSSSRSSKSSAAAAREKEEKDRADKLREKTREAKRKLKERAKEIEREKKRSEEEKIKNRDADTLKAVFGVAGPPVKIPKKTLSDKAKPSFEALIGIPGSSEEGTKVVKEVKSDKSSKSSMDTDVKAPSVEKEESPKSNEPPKERKHKAKVYVSHKSKHADLLESMTKGAKASSKPSDKDKNEKSAKTSSAGMSFEDALLAGARPTTSKPTKRPSIDNTKGGNDTKKAKIDDDASKKDKPKDKDEDKSKSKEKGKTSPRKQQLQESSLFMDQLVATADTKTPKRKRRTSSSDSKPEPEAAVVEPSGKPAEDQTKDAVVPDGSAAAESTVMKPVFGFYQNRNEDDDDDAAKANDNAMDQSEPMEQDSLATNTEASSTPASPVEPMEEDVFAPQEGEGQLRSCLRIVTPKGKPKKSIRWREEDELTEMFYFEHDETERVNVTRPSNNFAEQQKKEITDEKIAFNNKNKMLLDNEGEERFPWRPPKRILVEKEEYAVRSEEQKIQEQREQTILQVFFLPGTTIPESPTEPDLANSKPDEFHVLKQVSCDDVPVLTKVSDYSQKRWPAPKDLPNSGPTPMNIPINMPPPPMVPPTLALALTAEILRSQALQQPPPPADGNPFVQAAAAQAANPFTAPMPNPNAFSMAFQFPNTNVNSNSGFGGGGNLQGGFNSHGDRDERRNFRDRDMRDSRNNRDRPFDNDRGFGRGDRGRGRGDRGDNFRDRGGFGRESRFSDRSGGPPSRGGGGVRRVPCRFFVRGHCKDGENCTFLHPGVNGPSADGISGNFNRRGRGGFPSRGGYNSDHGNRDNYNSRQERNNAMYDPETPTSPDRDELPPIQSPTPEFFDTPSSPTETPSNEAPRVIPSGHDDDDTWG